MKRLSIALMALGLSAPAFADIVVEVPSQQGGFKIGIDALYLRPHNSNLSYATLLSPPIGGDLPIDFERNAIIDPTYDWGFYAQIGYLFPCTGNDLTLGYTYLHADATDSIDRLANEDEFLSITVLPMATLFNSLDPVFGTFEHVTGKTKFDLDAVDLEGGQRFTTGAYDMRMFAGLRYARLEYSLQSIGTSDVSDPSESEIVYTAFGNQIFDSNFRGIGPRIGVDGRYCFNSGFGLDASLSTALLVGNLSKSYQVDGEIAPFGLPIISGDFKSANSSISRVVPNIEAKLGVDYTYPLSCGCGKSALMFEVGYQATNYFNAVDHTTVVTTDGTALAYRNTTTDVAFEGIYAGIKYYA